MVSSPPVFIKVELGLEILSNMFTSFLKLKLVQDDIKVLWITELQFVCSRNLSIHMT